MVQSKLNEDNLDDMNVWNWLCIITFIFLWFYMFPFVNKNVKQEDQITID